jgi:hypothetical protein
MALHQVDRLQRRAVWSLIARSSSFERQGYLKRGFDDIDWL